ncbi:MAG: dihydrolipoamide acetyltransferase family protein [Candidatus Aenigmatarchaeota archaeon]
MPFEFKFPDVGEGITEGEIVRWLVKEGEKVKSDQPIVEVETDKAIVELPSPRAGTILKLHHKVGDTIKVGEVLVTIGEEGEKLEEKEKFYGVVGELPAEEKFIERKEITTVKAKPQVLATPAVRRLARELKVDLTKIKGTGKDGRITEEDVRKAAQVSMLEHAPEETTKPMIVKKEYDMYGYVERIPIKGVRKVIAEKMSKGANLAAPVTHIDEADVTELVKWREREKIYAEQRGIKLTFLPFIMKACARALMKHSIFNASFDDEHYEIIIKKYYNIGFAVDTPAGLMVPVVKGVNEKSILEIAKEIFDLAEAARKRTIDLADLKGGTFTITNYGSIRGIFGTPIINYPEVAILGVGRIFDRLVSKDKKIYIRKILPLSFTFDHRVADGAEAARFMDTLIKYLEDPGLLLAEEE